MVPERGSAFIVIHNHPCHTILHLIRFLCITKGTKVPLKAILLIILLIVPIEIPHQTPLRSPRLLIYAYHIFLTPH